jgi:hypothetical protein
LQSEGETIPKEMVKKPAENKFKHPETTHHYATNSINGMVLSKAALVISLYSQRRPEHGLHM